MNVSQYIESVHHRYKSGICREHAYRRDLEELIRELVSGDTGRVWINDEQYFDNVPLIAWEFYIGGYQPAQKWLKDRNGRTLNFDDILHYQKIIVALTETHRLMQEIDRIEVEG